MLGLAAPQAYLVLLIATLPVSAWVIWSDLKWMKIPNRAVLLLVAIYAVVGFAVIPPEIWAWRWLSLLGVLAAGFFLNAVANVGAGDAKFAAAAAPFVVQRLEHLQLVLVLLGGFLLSAFVAHRLMRRIPAVRAATPDWVSWTRADFPMGIALAGTFAAYLALMAFPEILAGNAS